MGLKEILKKSGGEKFNMDGWFTLKDPTLDDVRRITAKGELEERGFSIPVELRKYLDISPEGELIEKQEIPQELQSLADETREAYRRITGDTDNKKN